MDRDTILKVNNRGETLFMRTTTDAAFAELMESANEHLTKAELAALLEQADSWGYTALMYHSQYGRSKLVRQLIAAGVDVNAKKLSGSGQDAPITALSLAERNGFTKVVKLLKDAGATE